MLLITFNFLSNYLRSKRLSEIKMILTTTLDKLNLG